ncbi:MAG: hypothetical protein JWM73_2698, partial [Solirubrobacterales bacterium]|nr:hypothetical protein [Solirubrobacterales bacterium]
MDVDLFEAAPAGARSVLLRVAGRGAPAALSSTLIVQAPGRAEQLRALPASEAVEGGRWRAAFAIDQELLDAATRFTLIAGQGRPLTLAAPEVHTERPALERRLAEAEAARDRAEQAAA